MNNKYLVILMLFSLVLANTPSTYASNWDNSELYVDMGGSDSNDGLTPERAKKTIQNAINRVKDGGIIHVKSGLYKENLYINKDVQIIGEGAETTTINGCQKNTAIRMYNHKILLQGLKITNGYGGRYGGGIYSDKCHLTIQNCLIQQNEVHPITTGIVRGPRAWGGGIYTYYGDLIVENSTIQKNKASEGGGIYCDHTPAVIKNSIIQHNTVTWLGGGVLIKYARLCLENTMIQYNQAVHSGGIDIRWGHLTGKDSIIQNNTAKEYGGGITAYSCVLDLNGIQVINNNASKGPDVYHNETSTVPFM